MLVFDMIHDVQHVGDVGDDDDDDGGDADGDGHDHGGNDGKGDADIAGCVFTSVFCGHVKHMHDVHANRVYAHRPKRRYYGDCDLRTTWMKLAFGSTTKPGPRLQCEVYITVEASRSP